VISDGAVRSPPGVDGDTGQAGEPDDLPDGTVSSSSHHRIDVTRASGPLTGLGLSGRASPREELQLRG